MSKSHTPTERTEQRTTAPDTHQLAAELGVDAQLLAAFVENHHRPTAPIVIGWAHGRGELRCHPEQLRDEVAAWIDDRRGSNAALTEEELRDRVDARVVRSIMEEGE